MSAVPTIGILMLATRFPRPVGDIGNPASFDCPVLTETIAPATPERVVRGDPSALLPLFTEAGHRLVRRGATLVSTSCGFLTRFQDELSGALPVPVLTSSLFAAARLDAPAIMTIDAAALTPVHLAAARVPAGTPVGGMDGTAFAHAILLDAVDLDVERARAEHVERARALVAAHPQTRNIVLECTNMGPYADAIRAATGARVHSIVDLLKTQLASQTG